MPRATCRCGERLVFSRESSERIVCPRCGARVRARLPGSQGGDDGYVRFECPCGRRLKVASDRLPSHGKCPDCGRVLPVPAESLVGRAPRGPETETAELDVAERAVLERWSREHTSAPVLDTHRTPPVLSGPATAPSNARAEVGLRVCPKCKRPVHLGADVCRACGTSVPRR